MDDAARREAPGEFVTLSRGVTHYQWHGHVDGPVIVMVHGLSSASWVFSGLFHGLSLMGFRILTYDLYGRGYSDRPPGEQDKDFFVGQLEELLTALGIPEDKEICLFGYSMGGAISTCYAAKHPETSGPAVPAGLGGHGLHAASAVETGAHFRTVRHLAVDGALVGFC